ncbi:diacylglycerol/lipid kinase family protein [Haloarchaeobius sp. TZWWS8]|uniref:diacylglycerol/lipid kinase family protein n=1 Tax=Haloarchaeobius sp. TZWWS8 TaxID=3446121 RepID=UPI003EB8EC9A
MQVGSRRAIVNPVSGTGDHAEYVERLLRARGFEVVETEGTEDGIRLGREAGEDDVSELVVCGGDGTINEVLRGLHAAGHLDEVTLSVVPVGTANLLATNVGIEDIQQGVEVADTGEKRRVDVGMAADEPFLVSCIAGLPADASVAASSDLKERFGTLAFLVTGVQEALEFDGLNIRLDAKDAAIEESWEGQAACLLVGNARKFVEEGGPGDMEDGRFDVAVAEQMPASSLVAEAIGHRLLGQDTPGVTHIRASEIRIAGQDGPIRFSRDGELGEYEELALSVWPQALTLRVGPTYEPSPD